MPIARRFSITNFGIATSALMFQVFVLYPWHKQLDDDFAELKKEHVEVLKRGEDAMSEIREALRKMEEEKRRRVWFWQ